MRQGLRRTGWWFRRLHSSRIIGFLAVAFVAAGAGWLYGGIDSAALSGIVALGAGVVLGRPLTALFSRLFLRPPPWRTTASEAHFGNASLGFHTAGFPSDVSPALQMDEIAGDGGRFESGEITIELWVVAGDREGHHWTIVQEQAEPPLRRAIWTSTIDGRLAIGDFDDTGRPNPFRAAHRLVKSEMDVPVVDIALVAWGREEIRSGDRDVVIAVARTSIDAERLHGFIYEADGYRERYSHPVPLTPDGVAKALGWGHASDWRGGAVLGLLDLLEREHPGAWATLERRVAARWREKAMFARLERGAEHVTGRAVGARP